MTFDSVDKLNTSTQSQDKSNFIPAILATNISILSRVVNKKVVECKYLKRPSIRSDYRLPFEMYMYITFHRELSAQVWHQR